MWLVTKPMPSTRLFLPMTNRASDFSLHTTYTLSPGLSESYVEMSLKPFAWAISSALVTHSLSVFPLSRNVLYPFMRSIAVSSIQR